MNRPILAAFAAATALGGCYKMNFHHTGPPGEVHRQEMHVGLINGMIELDEPIRLDQMCPDGGFHAVRQQMGVISWLLASITGHLIVPHDVLVTCNDGSAYGVDLDEAGFVADAVPVAD